MIGFQPRLKSSKRFFYLSYLRGVLRYQVSDVCLIVALTDSGPIRFSQKIDFQPQIVQSFFAQSLRDIPALILWGMHDPAFREEELDRLQTVFARKRTACFHDAGHFPHEERSERVLSLVEEFLSG